MFCFHSFVYLPPDYLTYSSDFSNFLKRFNKLTEGFSEMRGCLIFILTFRQIDCPTKNICQILYFDKIFVMSQRSEWILAGFELCSVVMNFEIMRLAEIKQVQPVDRVSICGFYQMNPHLRTPMSQAIIRLLLFGNVYCAAITRSTMKCFRHYLSS